jgi:hypothetical protein
MKRLILLILCSIVLLVASIVVVNAADCTFAWKASSGATGYYLEYSTDNGVTWVGKKTTGPLTPDSNGEVSYLYTGIPETGLVIVRVAATNATSEAVRLESGAWYNHQWKPIGAPSGAGVR